SLIRARRLAKSVSDLAAARKGHISDTAMRASASWRSLASRSKSRVASLHISITSLLGLVVVVGVGVVLFSRPTPVRHPALCRHTGRNWDHVPGLVGLYLLLVLVAHDFIGSLPP